jgi:hypothetical protein
MMTMDEIKSLGVRLPASVAPKRSKYRNVPTTYNGVRYASRGEAQRAEWLDMQVGLGNVLFWVGQPKFRLGCPENVYVADFLVVTRAGVYVEDVKGAETAKFKRDKKLWKAYGPCELVIVRGGNQNNQVLVPDRLKA